jgi:hypothetical protein
MEELETSRLMNTQKEELQTRYKKAMSDRQFDKAGELHARIMTMQNVHNRMVEGRTKVRGLIASCEALAIPLRCEADRCVREFVFSSAAESYAAQVDGMLTTLRSRPEIREQDKYSEW